MNAAVQLLYREGVMVPHRPHLIGKIFSGRHKGVSVLYLWPLEWTDSTSPLKPLAMLWHPVCVVVGHENFCFRGVEAAPCGRSRRWAVQKWLCYVLTHQQALARREPDRRIGDVTPWVPPTRPAPPAPQQTSRTNPKG